MEVDSFSNELKLSIGYDLLGFPEIAYEKLINDDSGIGLSLGFSLENNIVYNFNVLPYYRLYFGAKRAGGFFIEGNMGVYSEEVNEAVDKYQLGLGAGIAIGGKFINKSGWVGEIFDGAGINFVNQDQISDAYPRFGLMIGKRS